MIIQELKSNGIFIQRFKSNETQYGGTGMKARVQLKRAHLLIREDGLKVGFKSKRTIPPDLFGSAAYSSACRSSEFSRHLLTTYLLIFVVHAYVPPKIKNNKVLLKRNQIKIKRRPLTLLQ